MMSGAVGDIVFFEFFPDIHKAPLAT
jgi:hypothetical protein